VPSPRVRLSDPIPGWDALRDELHVPGQFAADVLAEAQTATPTDEVREDLTDLPFFTVDPTGSTDLDQAMALTTSEAGYRIRYAIADVAAFVQPGGLIDQEAHRRGETLYAPDRKSPLHPPILSEGRASLLLDQTRPAVVWTLDLDTAGELTATDVRRALVRSRRQLDYATAQSEIDSGRTPDLLLLKEIGLLRQTVARNRGAVDLPTPEQEVDRDGHLTFRAQLPAEQWNAQISLLTGMAAARLMLEGKVGLLRTLPPPDPHAVASLRRSALALGIAWPEGTSYGDVLSSLDPTRPEAAAVLALAPRLLRGAAYTAFDGTLPAQPLHSAVAAPYAHATAPLRRLADRYVSEICLSLRAGTAPPRWVLEALPTLPAEMAAADHRAHALDRAIVDLAEAMVLQHRVGEVFEGVVVESTSHGGTLQLTDPAVRGRLDAPDPPLARTVHARLEEAEPATRSVRFALA
jgi:exoribonuclease R